MQPDTNGSDPGHVDAIAQNSSNSPIKSTQFIELPQLSKSNSKPSVISTSGTGTWKDFVLLPSLPKLCGWLHRQDDTLFATWKRRYFRLEGDKLYWYRSDQHLEHLGIIPIYSIEEITNRKLELKASREGFQLELKLKGKRMFLSCDTEQERLFWLDGINKWKDYFIGQMRSLNADAQDKQRPLSYPESPNKPKNIGNSTAPSIPKYFNTSTPKSQSSNSLPDFTNSLNNSGSLAQSNEAIQDVNVGRMEEEVENLKKIIAEKDGVVEEWRKLVEEKDELYKIQEQKLESLRLKNSSLEGRLKELESELHNVRNNEETIASFLNIAKEMYFKNISAHHNYNEQQENLIKLQLVDVPPENWIQWIRDTDHQSTVIDNQQNVIQDQHITLQDHTKTYHQNTDTQNSDQQNPDQQNSDQQNSDQQNPDQQNPDQQNSDQQNSDQQNPLNSDQQNSDQQGLNMILHNQTQN